MSGRQKSKEASFITWKIEFSIGGATELGRGLRYREMMVIPLENCSRKGFRSEEKLERHDCLTDVFARGKEGVEMVQVGEGAKWVS